MVGLKRQVRGIEPCLRIRVLGSVLIGLALGRKQVDQGSTLKLHTLTKVSILQQGIFLAIHVGYGIEKTVEHLFLFSFQ